MQRRTAGFVAAIDPFLVHHIKMAFSLKDEKPLINGYQNAIPSLLSDFDRQIRIMVRQRHHSLVSAVILQFQCFPHHQPEKAVPVAPA